MVCLIIHHKAVRCFHCLGNFRIRHGEFLLSFVVQAIREVCESAFNAIHFFHRFVLVFRNFEKIKFEIICQFVLILWIVKAIL